MVPSAKFAAVISLGLAGSAVAAPLDPSTSTISSSLPSSFNLSSPFNTSSPSISSNMTSPAVQTILMGSYAEVGAHVVYFTPPSSANATDGSLEVGPSLFFGNKTSWIAQHPQLKEMVYTVSEMEPQDGEIIAIKLSDNLTDFSIESRKSSQGAAPAHCAVIADGKALAVANYAGGSVFLQPLAANGSFSSSPGTLIKFPYKNTTTPLRNPSRQEASHPHEVVEVLINGTREVWVPDLGQDTIWRLAVIEEGETIRWELKEGEPLKGDEGGGPRHIVVTDNGENLYVLNELLPAVVHEQISNSSVSFQSKTSIVPPPPSEPVDMDSQPLGAELLLLNTSPKKTLLASVRTLFDRPTDALAAFSIEDDGKLTLSEFVYPKGREFRAVGTSKDDKYIVVGGQADGWVSVLGQDEEGKWRAVAESVQVDKPTGVLFL